MTKITLKQRLNATPLTKLRFIVVILMVFILAFIISLTLLGNDYVFDDDLAFLVVLIGVAILSFSMVIDIRNQRQWIRDTAEIEIILDKEVANQFNKIRKNKIKDFFIGGFAFFLPLILIFLIAVIMTSARELIIIGLVSIALYILILFMRKFLKKESDQIPVFLLSEIGMIYLKDYLIWGDKWSGTWLDEIDFLFKEDGNCMLMIRTVTTGRFGDDRKSYKIEIPYQSITDTNDLVIRIKAANQRNRYKRLRDKLHK